MPGRARPLELTDGSRVRIRAIEPADRELLRRGFERLSDRSRYQRFFSPVDSLSEATLDYLTQIDHHDHEALVAVDAESGELAGVARYVRVDDGVAEPAITVIDDWQGRGLSGALLDRLVARALEEDFRGFRAYVLYGNPRALEAMRRLGRTTSTAEGSTLQLDIELAEPDIDDGTLRDLLRSVADGALSPTLGLWRRLESVVRVSVQGRTEPWDGELGNAIVVGTDGSEAGGAAVRSAVALATALEAPLHAVAAYRPLLDSRGRADELLRGIEALLRGTDPDAQVHLRHGDPAEAIIAVAEEVRARTIVVGPGDSGGGSRRYLVGSVADKVARHAPCNVLIARAAP